MKRGLLASTIFAGMVGGLWSAAAVAQDASDDPVVVADQEDEDEEARQERIVVTGSRIRRESSETIDITVVDSVEIEQRGFVNAIEALEQIPLVQAGVNNTGAAVQNGDNNAFVNLLGIGTQRTLTLVNGQRFVTSNQGTVFVPGNDSGAQVDLTIINPALIERTETLTVGGGPIYGADAVAGVVNIILKDDYEGAELTAQGGLTTFGDGGEFRVSGLWGKNFFDGRANLTIGVEYNDQDIIRGGGGRDFSNVQTDTIINPLSLSTSDGIPDTVFESGLVNPTIPVGGALLFGNDTPLGPIGGFAGSGAALFFPNTGELTGGLTPFEFALSPAGAGVNPLAFVGTFGDAASFLSVPNTDPATSGFLPRVAVPLTFNEEGQLVPLSLGQVAPPFLADQDDVVGGGGFNDPTTTNLRSGQERISGNVVWRYDISDNLRYKGDFLISNIQNRSAAGVQTQALTGTTSNGAFALPIFIDENPLLGAGNLAILNDIEAQNIAAGEAGFNTIDGSRVVFLGRTLFDVVGGLDNIEGDNQLTFRTTHALEGDFNWLNRDFYWSTTFGYGRSRADNLGAVDILDVEFAIASDVVADPVTGEAVCRQQTLDAPEAISDRNPGLLSINIATGLVPTQEQIDACVPLNLFGNGAPSQEAIDFVTSASDSENVNEQFFANVSFGGDLVDLPAGSLAFNSQFEWRREELEFTPGPVFALGLGRATIGQASEGQLTFFEGGTEFVVPVFGEEFKPLPFFTEYLELNGVVRVVARGGEGTDPTGFADSVSPPGTIDVTFTGGGRWSPFEGVTIRGNRTRSVRTASIVELFGAPQTGFVGTGSALFACNAFFGSGGPASGIRQENCETFAETQGLTAADLAAIVPPVQAAPAGVAGNPALVNEEANNWTVGITLEPSFIPGLTISSDYISILIDDVIGLSIPFTECFDSPDFPNTLVGGVAVCEGLVLGVEDPDNPGLFIIPEINTITGNPTNPVAIPGSISSTQSPFTIGFLGAFQLNGGSQRLDALNSTIRYDFELNDLISLFTPSPFGIDLGQISLSGNVYFIRRFENSPSGTFDGDIETLDGEVGSERFQTRFDLSHRIGPLTQRLQWFRDSAAVEDADETDPFDEEPDFFRPSFNTFNYNVSYDVTDNVTAGLVVNNLTNARILPQFGIAGGLPGAAIGRSFIMRVSARF